MRKLGIEEWLIKTVESIYSNAISCVRVNCQFSSWFDVQVGVPWLSSLLFVMIIEAISREFRTGCPWELLYANDLFIIAETLDLLLVKFHMWKANMEGKGLRVNVGKTKILKSTHNAPKPLEPIKYPCGVCGKGVGTNSI